MKKVVYTKVGGLESIEIVEQKREPIREGEVRVRVHRAGINFADLMMTGPLWRKPRFSPFTPGHEASGEVTEIGKKVSKIKLNDRVIAIPGFGGYAEELVLSENRVVKIPKEMSYEQVAAIPNLYGTAYHMLVHLGEG